MKKEQFERIIALLYADLDETRKQKNVVALALDNAATPAEEKELLDQRIVLSQRETAILEEISNKKLALRNAEMLDKKAQEATLRRDREKILAKALKQLEAKKLLCECGSPTRLVEDLSVPQLRSTAYGWTAESADGKSAWLEIVCARKSCSLQSHHYLW